MAGKKQIRINKTHFNIVLTVIMLGVVLISVGISLIIIDEIERRDGAGVQNGTTNNAGESTPIVSTPEPLLSEEEYYELAMESFQNKNFADALSYSYFMLDVATNETRIEEIYTLIADLYVAEDNLRAAYYLLEDSGVDGLLSEYCKEKTDLTGSLSLYEDATDEDYLYMGYYPQTGYSEEEVPEYVKNVTFDSNNFARIYGVEYTRVAHGDAYTYFVSEPVRWWIIKETDKEYTVLSDKLIDCKPFHNAISTVTWDTSALKVWLNGEFMKRCFNDGETARITEHTTPASYNYYFQFSSGAETKDYIGIIPAASLSDKTHVFMDHDSEKSKLMRKSLATDYAIALGAFTEDGYGKWWTATSANVENLYTVTVTHEGIVLIVSGGEAVNKSDVCVRPYMTISK